MRLEIPFRVMFFVWLAITLFMTLNPAPPFVNEINVNDKIEHGLTFAGLAGLAGLGFTRAAPGRILERLSFIGALIEVFQAIPWMHRSCDWKDWLADTAGVALGLMLLPLARRILHLPKATARHDQFAQPKQPA